jgi:hypothetical protein
MDMHALSKSDARHGQTGGITILVALMMLIFLTVTAVGLSRNSFREVVLSGTARQGSMARNVADAGIEWSIYWMDLQNSTNAGAPQPLTLLKQDLLATPTLAGQSWDVTSATPTAYTPGNITALTLAPITTPLGTTITQSFTAGLTSMGKLPVWDTSQSNGSGAFAPATGAVNPQAPDLWAVRIDSQINAGTVTFTHAKEVWLTTAPQ